MTSDAPGQAFEGLPADESPVDNRAELASYLGFAPAERALLAQMFLASGVPDAALELAGEGAQACLALALCKARAQSALGQPTAALATLDLALAGDRHNPLGLFYRAQILLQSGKLGEGRALLAELSELAPDFPGAMTALARLTFPGPQYRELLALTHRLLQPQVYLEIGVEQGGSLCLATQSEVVLGVEPVARAPRHPLPRGARVFHQTSDDFFAQHERGELLGARHVDLAFIDGMHRFEYVLRDFCNVERWCAPTSTIVLHDCLPVAPSAALPARRSRFWVGDCWKAIECLIAHRPDLTLTTLPCYPSGLIVVRGLDPASRVLSERMPELERQYADRPYPYSPGSWPAAYRVVDNTAAGLALALGLDARP